MDRFRNSLSELLSLHAGWRNGLATSPCEGAVVGPTGETSNQLFETLQRWNTVLERHQADFEEPAP